MKAKARTHLVGIVNNQPLLRQIVVVFHGTVKGGDCFLRVSESRRANIELVSRLSKDEIALVSRLHLSLGLHRFGERARRDYSVSGTNEQYRWREATEKGRNSHSELRFERAHDSEELLKLNGVDSWFH